MDPEALAAFLAANGEKQPASPKLGQLLPKKGLLIPGNIDIHKRPVVHNPDGTISTVRSMSIGTDQGEVLIPTVSEDGRILTDQQAVDQYYKTGRHLGIFSDPDSATSFAKRLHDEQANEYRGR